MIVDIPQSVADTITDTGGRDLSEFEALKRILSNLSTDSSRRSEVDVSTLRWKQIEYKPKIFLKFLIILEVCIDDTD